MIAAMRTLLLSLIMACTACTTNAGAPPERQAPPSSAKPAPAPGAAAGGTLEQIRAMIGSAACTGPGQCRTLPVGARACGGPEAYLPYSTANLSEPALQALAERYTSERQAENEKSGMRSTCQVIQDPGAECRAGTCQLRSGGGPLAM